MTVYGATQKLIYNVWDSLRSGKVESMDFYNGIHWDLTVYLSSEHRSISECWNEYAVSVEHNAQNLLLPTALTRSNPQSSFRRYNHKIMHSFITSMIDIMKFLL